MDQRDVSGTVRIILDCSNATWYSIFIPFEIDNAVFTLMSAALVTNRNFTLVVTTRFFLLRGAKSDFSGVDVVISSNVETDIARLAGDVGLYFF